MKSVGQPGPHIHLRRKERIMNKDQVAGRVEEAKGKIKEAAGKVVGNEKLQGEGVADQAAGKVQKTYGDVKEDAKDAIKRGADKL